MIALISLSIRVWFIVIIVSIIFIVKLAVTYYGGTPMDPAGIFLSLSSSIGLATLFIVIAGRSAWFLRLLYSIPKFKTFVGAPDLNGVWIGPQRSAFQASMGITTPLRMTMVIKQSLLDISVETKSEDGQTTSQCLSATPIKENERVFILSFYRGLVKMPAAGDAQTHHGASMIRIDPGENELYGTYASDRGLLTTRPSSGDFVVRRFSNDPDHMPAPTARDAFYEAQDWSAVTDRWAASPPAPATPSAPATRAC